MEDADITTGAEGTTEGVIMGDWRVPEKVFGDYAFSHLTGTWEFTGFNEKGVHDFLKDFWNNPDAKTVDYNAKSDYAFGWLYDWYYDYNERLDRERMDADLYRHTGQSWQNSPYPWYSYRNNSYTGRFDGGTFGDIVEATESVINMWSSKLKRW